MKNFLYIFVVILVFSACSDSKSGSTAAANGAIKGKNYSLVPMNNSLQYQTPPTISMHDYRNGNISFNIQNFNLGTKTPDADEQIFPNNAELGQHVTVFIDGKEIGKTNTPIIAYNLNDGKYVLTAVLTKSYNETLKNEEASFTRRIIVRDGGIFAHSDSRPEMVVYHQPSGTYSGAAAKKIPLDFYLFNADIKGAYRILLDINNGKDQFYLSGWQPYYLEGLPAGENTVKLYLVYTNGEVVNVPINVVQETFTVAP
ncbi:MAG: hypothetical protein AB8G22_10870 [Saprospiraceae bacterium]